MSTTLLFLVPIGMLAVAWSFCFVGCALQTHGLEPPYSDNIVGTPGLVAYWPLGDLLGTLNVKGQTSGAGDLSGNGHNGTYIIPPAYPTNNPQSTPTINPPSLSRQGSIVPGDTGGGGTKNPFPASVDFEGGYVSIPWSTQNSPTLPEFTLEAWVQPHWTQAQSGFIWVVFGAVTNTTGFALYINANNQWQLTIGNGTTLQIVNTMVPFDLTSPVYVAVTCDNNGNMSLWINPQSQSDLPNPPPPPPTWTSSTPTGYVAVDPTQPVTFFIGSGDNEDAQTLRTQDGGAGSPLFPFRGQIQSVALYSSVLDASTLQSHFEDGTA